LPPLLGYWKSPVTRNFTLVRKQKKEKVRRFWNHCKLSNSRGQKFFWRSIIGNNGPCIKMINEDGVRSNSCMRKSQENWGFTGLWICSQGCIILILADGQITFWRGNGKFCCLNPMQRRKKVRVWRMLLDQWSHGSR